MTIEHEVALMELPRVAARAERAEAQLAALREAADAMSDAVTSWREGDEADWLRVALADPAAAAEAYTRRVRAEALREAAEALGGRMQVDGEVGDWLRARADEIERG